MIIFQPKKYGFEDDDVKGAKLPEYFNLPVIALVIIVILNDFAIISIAYDYVIPSSIPEKWNLKIVFTVACWLGAVSVCGQMMLLDMALDKRGEIFHDLSYGQIMMMVWLTVSLLDFFSVFSARVANGFFFERKLGTPLLCAALFALALSTVLSVAWPLNNTGGSHDPAMENLQGKHVLYVWIYCLIWFAIQDTTKVLVYKVLLYFDFEGLATDLKRNEERAAVIKKDIEQRQLMLIETSIEEPEDGEDKL